MNNNILLSSSLALDVSMARLRDAGGSCSRATLARLAGLTRRQLARLETATALPRDVENLLAIAIATGTTIDELVTPQAKRAIAESVNARRAVNGMPRSPSTPRESPRRLAACMRVGVLALAVMEGDRLVGVVRHYPREQRHARKLVRSVMALHACEHLVVEARRGHLALRDASSLSFESVSRIVLGDSAASQGDLLKHMLMRFPELVHRVTVDESGRVATVTSCDRRRSILLLAVALGLAAHRKDLIKNLNHFPSNPFSLCQNNERNARSTNANPRSSSERTSSSATPSGTPPANLPVE